MRACTVKARDNAKICKFRLFGHLLSDEEKTVDYIKEYQKIMLQNEYATREEIQISSIRWHLSENTIIPVNTNVFLFRITIPTPEETLKLIGYYQLKAKKQVRAVCTFSAYNHPAFYSREIKDKETFITAVYDAIDLYREMKEWQLN